MRLSHISKRFGSLVALDDVSFEVRPGEIHALVGENGAGKTTLMRIAYGMIQPDTGDVAPNPSTSSGHDGRLASPAAARLAGIGMVHQHFTSIPALSVGENIALAAGWRESGRRAEARASELIARLGFPIEAAAMVGGLSAQLRQQLEVVKALAADARVLLLDEPSAVLAPREVQELLEQVRLFARAGGAVVLITHKLNEVFAVADRVTVLRRGEVVKSGPLAEETVQSLARAMIGGELVPEAKRTPTPGEAVVCATGLTLASADRTFIHDASFACRIGEIVGIAAIDGNGHRELLRAMAGLDEVRITDGTLTVSGPVSFVPEDRTIEGVIPDFSLAENVLLGSIDRGGWWIDRDELTQRTARLMQEFDVRGSGPEVAVGTLSGGNQQKLIFARALDRVPRVLVAEDPTRGLDIFATAAIHERLREAARSGTAVIVHSSDLDEVLALADRVFVVAAGMVTECVAGASRDAIGDAMLGIGALR